MKLLHIVRDLMRLKSARKELRSRGKMQPWLVALLLASLSVLHAAEPIVRGDLDRETLDKWSAPYRGWHYWPAHVIPAEPNIPGHEKFHNTDVPFVYNPKKETFYLYCCAVGCKGRGIGLVTSKPLPPPASTDTTGAAPNKPAIDQGLPRSAAVHVP